MAFTKPSRHLNSHAPASDDFHYGGNGVYKLSRHLIALHEYLKTSTVVVTAFTHLHGAQTVLHEFLKTSTEVEMTFTNFPGI